MTAELKRRQYLAGNTAGCCGTGVSCPTNMASAEG